LEQFVIRYVYSDTKSKTLRDARAVKWRAEKKKSTIRLEVVPDSDSLRPHLGRTNYLAYLLKHYQLQSHPSPIGHGWHLVNGLCACPFNTAPTSTSIPLLTKPEAEINSDYGGQSELDSD